MAGSDQDSVGVPKIIDNPTILNENATFTVPTGKLWRLVGFSGDFATVAGGANRTVRALITPQDGGETVGVEAAVDQVPNFQNHYFFSLDVPSSVAFGAGDTASVQLPSLLLDGVNGDEGNVTFNALNNEAGDAWVAPILHVVEYAVRAPS